LLPWHDELVPREPGLANPSQSLNLTKWRQTTRTRAAVLVRIVITRTVSLRRGRKEDLGIECDRPGPITRQAG
jgi:hypothetical protein